MLIGYRGSGKSTVGRLLADRLGYAFVDSDTVAVERFNGKSIARVWGEHGESVFRAVESQVVQELVQRERCVIALGGGAVIDYAGRSDGRDAVQGADVLCVYLHAEAATLAERIAGDAASAQSRPSLTGHRSAVDEVSAVLAVRDPLYRAVADMTVDVTRLGVEAVVDAVIARTAGSR